MKTIPKKLVDILACPLCKAGLGYNKAKKELICSKCKADYTIKEDIPILLPKNSE